MKKFYYLLILFTTFGIAQTKNHYNVSWVNADDGLKQLSVRYCVSDKNGFIWIATELGLYRYDGRNLKEINENKYPSLSKQRITKLGKDSNTGKIYLQTFPENYQYIIDNNYNIERVSSFDNEKYSIITFNNLSHTSSSSIIRNVLKHQKAEEILNEYYSNTFLDACLNSNFLFIPQFKHFLVFDKKGTLIEKKKSFSTNLQLFQFGEKVLAADNGKIFFISEGKNNVKKIKVDAIFQKYLNRDYGNQSNIEIFGSNNCYYLKYNNGIFQIIFNKDTIITNYLFDAPADDITSICYSKKDNLYFVGTQTRGLAVLKPISFNTILFDDRTSYKSINYCYSVAAISNNKWYCASGWIFNPTTKKSSFESFQIDNNNTRFILQYKNKFYINSKNNLWNIENHKKDFDFLYPDKENQNLFCDFQYSINYFLS
jgi:ligand-binding sensor domain-containing protein